MGGEDVRFRLPPSVAVTDHMAIDVRALSNHVGHLKLHDIFPNEVADEELLKGKGIREANVSIKNCITHLERAIAFAETFQTHCAASRLW